MAGKILIVDDVATTRIVLKSRLARASYTVLLARCGVEALRLIRDEQPDLVLLAAQLLDCDGFDMCRRLRALPGFADLPIIMTSAQADLALVRDALQAGADDLIPHPCDETDLLARVRTLMRTRDAGRDLLVEEDFGLAEAGAAFAHPGRIGIVTADRETALSWKVTLGRHLPGDTLLALAPEEALAAASAANCPEAFLIAADLRHRNEGLRLMSDLRARTGARHAAICIALPSERPSRVSAAFDLGADDLLVGPVHRPLMAEQAALRLRRLIAKKRSSDRRRENLRTGLRLAVTDPLTGLHNRRYAMPQLLRMADRARRLGQTFAVMVLDLDRFKAINDTWGHLAGDTVLIEVGQRLCRSLGPGDLLARIGGEEFLIAMPDTTLAAASRIADQICETIRARPVVLGSGNGVIPVTASIGLAIGGDSADTSIEELIDRADHALLDSKADGRNQVTVFRRTAA
ncbi:diguanylate cyclase [Sinirhodobacter populi]|uniref:diguanylate cyclase n=1 Tax=Paenirhodobacter populi TaxID=2306993 RepID=A0A443KMS1_9RHOB|nr:diguanylate cyclase [Sinirhodobacter populi]RWR34103.1 diguanylate cyclase [Sinirhodobacter populi]